MKILIDINHPAHVHYFKNFIKIMKEKGNEFIVTNRNDKIINSLLDLYGISHFIRNSRPKKNYTIYSAFYLIVIILNVLKLALKRKVNFFIGFSSFPCTFVAFLLRKPVIILDDTEHNIINHFLLKPFNPIILTPYYYKKKLWSNQIYINSFIEQLYLRSNYFENNKKFYNSDYALLRFSAFDARHDVNIKMLSPDFKKQIITYLEQFMTVFVSVESSSKESFYNKYRLNISPDEMHYWIANASFVISEGATMASEAAILGTPYIYINPIQEVGNIKEQVSKFPVYFFKSINDEDILSSIKLLLKAKIDQAKREKVREYFEKNTIDLTAFIVWFVENYPESAQIMKENPDYQNNFK